MDAFFKGKYVTLQDADGESVEIYMTPWTVREYIDYLEKTERVMEKYGKTSMEAETEAMVLVMDAIEEHVETGTDLSLHLLNELINAFTDLNFGKAVESGTKRKSPKIEDDKLLSIVFDFLISQGHRFSEIMEYRLPQFLAFNDAACERLSNMYGGKKPKEENIDAALDKIGVHVR